MFHDHLGDNSEAGKEKKTAVCLCFLLSVILLIRFSFQVTFCITTMITLMRDFECITRFYFRHRSALR